MQRIFSRVLLIILLLSHVAQAAASVAMVCADTHNEPSVEQTLVAHHQMTNMEMDCCDDDDDATQDCSCPISVCNNYSLHDVTGLVAIIAVVPDKALTPFLYRPRYFATSLYRPPILA